MATRFYLCNSGAAAVSPAFDAGWEQTGEADRIKLVRKSLLDLITTLANRTVTVPITTTQDILSRQFVSDPLPSQVIGGTFSLVVRVSENATTNNAHIAVSVRVCSQDGGTFRGTLYSVFANATEFAVTASAATRIINAVSVTSQTAQAGDRLVIEIGTHVAAPTAAGSAIHRYGCSAASDFALTSALTTDLNPWCEFSQDLWAGMPNNYQSIQGGGLSVGERIR